MANVECGDVKREDRGGFYRLGVENRVSNARAGTREGRREEEDIEIGKKIGGEWALPEIDPKTSKNQKHPSLTADR